MNIYSVEYEYGGSMYELLMKAESFEDARNRASAFKASRVDESRIHCYSDATPTAELPSSTE